MTKDEKRKYIKKIDRTRRRSLRHLEWQILAYIVLIILLCTISYQYQDELERLLNPIYYSGAQQIQVIPVSNDEEPQMKVHFIDVGCADATFIELPNNKTMLIDCAGDLLDTNNSINALMRYLEVEIYSQRQNKILDYLIVSHPDRDHYAGAKAVINAYEVRNIVRPLVLSESEHNFYANNNVSELEDDFCVKYDLEYEEFISEAKNELAMTPYGNMFFGGVGVDFSDVNFKLEIIAPNKLYYNDEWNNYSSCIRLEYLNKVFIFTGDAQIEIEDELIEKYAYDIGFLNADVLKVGHHGSETSSSNNFLNAVKADYYIASTRSGVYSSVPSNSVITNISSTFPQSKIFRTDTSGNIVFSVTNKGNIAIYTNRGSFDFVQNFVYIEVYYVLICIAIMLYILIFKFRGTTRADILEMRAKKREQLRKERQKILDKRKKELEKKQKNEIKNRRKRENE